VPSELLTTGEERGAKARYFSKDNVGLENGESSVGSTLATRIEAGIDTTSESVPAAAADAKPLTVKWEATLTPKETGDYSLGIETDGFFRLFLDGKSVTTANYPHGVETHMGQVHLDAGQPYRVVVDYQRTDDNAPLHVRLLWHKVDRSVDPAVVAAAQNADVVVAVVGITSKLEGEEMLVGEPGVKGGDRTSLDLPEPERNLLEAVETAHKPLVVVLTNGSALAVNWANEHANAILDAWYPGEEGGTAVAETLSGANDPAGRLPVTFYKSVDQLPPFEDYAMKGRTYRYFTGAPLYPFGYGLSYTKFHYSDLKGPSGAVHAGDTVVMQATVTNTGARAGDEVAQLYLSFPPVAGAPLRALRGFERVHLEPGASTTVHFELKARDLSMVTEAGEPVVAAGEYHVSIGGGQPIAGTQSVAGGFAVEGTLKLPE